MTRLAKLFTPKTVSLRRYVLLVFGRLVLLYVAVYVVLSAFGGWGWGATGKFRFHFRHSIGFAMPDCYIWQPFIGDCQLFTDVSGENTLRGDNIGYFFAPLILLDQRFIHRTIYCISPDGSFIQSAKEPPRTDFHPAPHVHPFSSAPSPPLKEPPLVTICVLVISIVLSGALWIAKIRPEWNPEPAIPNP